MLADKNGKNSPTVFDHWAGGRHCGYCLGNLSSDQKVSKRILYTARMSLGHEEFTRCTSTPNTAHTWERQRINIWSWVTLSKKPWSERWWHFLQPAPWRCRLALEETSRWGAVGVWAKTAAAENDRGGFRRSTVGHNTQHSPPIIRSDLHFDHWCPDVYCPLCYTIMFSFRE